MFQKNQFNENETTDELAQINPPTLSQIDDAEEQDNVEEEAEEEEEEVNHKLHIPEDFFYDLDEVSAKPRISKDSGLPQELVKLYHSFGCDTIRRDNLKILGTDCVAFVSGNYLEIRNVESGERRFIRSIDDRGIGSVDVHPSGTHIAIAEKGDMPNVCIYEYPSLKLYRILREGTQTAYPSCQFSPDGTLMATVGDEPDFLLTIWNWREEHIVLRNKAFSQEIFRVRWSEDVPGVLVTAGSGHIRFWKMADTFTGLKLQGAIGKFGKVELSDIEGFVIMPDGKVLSGCEWGNLLLWEGDLIKVQIRRKDGVPCHRGLIMHILIYEGELLTVGTDGYVRTWEFEAIDQAEAQEEGTYLELEPMNELQVAPQAKLISLQKVEIEGKMLWYCLDANGGIWKLDLSFSHTSAPPKLILPYHAGAIMDCVVSPTSYLAASLGSDGSLRIFDVPKKAMLGYRRYGSSGRCMVWTPLHIDPKGKTIVTGHADGVVRVSQIVSEGDGTVNVELIQAIKPHTEAITAMDYDQKGTFFATASLDKTLFIFHVNGIRLEPSGFARLPTKALKIQWRTLPSSPDKPTLLLMFDNSCVVEVSVPYRPAPEKGTFEITDVQPLRGFLMESVAGVLKVEEQGVAKRLAYEEAKKQRNENLLKLLHDGHITQEDVARAAEDERRLHAKMEDEIAQMKPMAPEEPSPVIGGVVCADDPYRMWITLGDFDAGYMYKCMLMDLMDPVPKTAEQLKIEKDENREVTELEMVLPRIRSMKPLQSPKIVDSDDSELLSWRFTSTGNRVVMGFENGLIRVQMLESAFDFGQMGPFWTYAFSDNDRGRLNSVQLSFDDSYILSVAGDGTFFALELMTESMQEVTVNEQITKLPSSDHEPTAEEDIQDANEFSIEQARKKYEWDKLVEAGEERKRETRRQIAELRMRFKKLKEQNERLPAFMRVNTREYEMLDELREQLMKQREEQIDILNRQLAFESRRRSIALQKMIDRFRKDLACDFIVLKGFGTNDWVSSFRKKKLPEMHADLVQRLRDEVSHLEKVADAETKKRTLIREKSQSRVAEMHTATNTDLIRRSKVKGARGLRYMRQLETLEANRLKREKRRQQWEALYARKPTANWEDPNDVAAIEFVKNNMGDFKLKSSSNYFIPENQKPTALKSRLTLLEAMTQISERQDDFNRRLLNLRNKKAAIIKELKSIDENLKQIAEDLPPDGVSIRLKIDNLDDSEFPERAFDATDEALEAFKAKNNIKAPAEDDRAFPLSKSVTLLDESGVESVADPSGLNVYLHNDRKVVFISAARLVQPKSYYTLDIPFPHRPDVAGLHIHDEAMGSTVNVLITRQPFQPESMVDTIDDDMNKRDSKSILQDGKESEKKQSLFASSHSSESGLPLDYEAKRRHLRYERALYKQQYLVSEAGSLVRCFNMELRTLKHQKVNLELLMKRANLNVLIMYQEYKLLSDFEDGEKGLAANHRAKIDEKEEVDRKVTATELEIQSTLANIERLISRENELFEEFKEFLGDNHKWGDFLHKVYRKRIKRKAKRVRNTEDDGSEGGGGSSSEASSSASSESEWNESDEAADEAGEDGDDEFGEGANVLDLDICPPGCEQADYDQTVAFRNHRLDIEDEIAEQKRLLEVQRKEAETLAKRAKTAQQNLQQASSELNALQLEKQRKLNVLHRLVSLRLDQITFFQEKSLPQDFTPVLIFRRENLARLRRRIQSLDDEKRIQRREKKQAKERHLMLQRHKKIFQEELQQMAVKCDKMMIDKFGRLDDLEKLETIHPRVEEMALRTLALQARIQREEDEAEERLRDARDVYVVHLRENTRLVLKTLMLFNELQTLSNAMDNHMRNPNREVCEGIVKEREEIDNQIKKLQNQAEEINKLTAEIRCLSAKVPKVLPTVQPPPNMRAHSGMTPKSTRAE